MDGVFPGLEDYAREARIRKAVDKARAEAESEEDND